MNAESPCAHTTGSPLIPFHVTVLFQYPLKTSENLLFSDVFKGYKKRLVIGYQSTFLEVQRGSTWQKPLKAKCRTLTSQCFN